MKKGSTTEKRAIVVMDMDKVYVYTSSVKALEALTEGKLKTSIVNKLNKKMSESPDGPVEFMGMQFMRAPFNKESFKK
jgi:hypothetical protein